MHSLAQSYGVSLSNSALNYTLSFTDVSIAIVGSKSLDHIQHSAECLNFEISSEDAARVESILSFPP